MFCVNCKANKLKKSGGAGYVEPGKVIAWNGDTTGLPVLPHGDGWGNIKFGYKVSDDVVDLSKVTKLVTINGEISLEWSRIETNGIIQVLGNWDSPSTMPYAAVVPQDVEVQGYAVLKGTYFVEGIRSIEFAETIHPIDPKFLPNDTIDLDEFGIGEVLVRLLAQGGGSDIIQRLGDDSFWEKFMELKPNYVSLLFQGIPTKCAIATQMIGTGMEFLGFKAFMPSSSDNSIVEATAIISHWVQPGETAQDTRYNITVTVQM